MPDPRTLISTAATATTGQRLAIDDHNRAYAGMTYVYPVVSRRAGGVSIGINLNPNNACNWRCVYCQVPNLQRGGPPPINLPQLERELSQMLDDITQGAFMSRFVAPEQRILQDIAFSGNGEPTSSPEFAQAVRIAAEQIRRRDLFPQVKLRLITNGSLVDRLRVQEGLHFLHEAQGEVWFKCDAGDTRDAYRINGSRQKPDVLLRRLCLCAQTCATWIQSCFFLYDGHPPSHKHIDHWLNLIDRALDANAPLQGVYLYGLARPSFQPESARLGRLSSPWLEALAQRVRQRGLTVIVSP
jgi:wyosine [tRNA(Phe)-imidazoG37] synthetase (radical SAM superfamily)